ncbi:MAG: hypothetical protein J6S98_07855 [Lentisphaeria bacterium]|nr:hypothetical protein [Lentisphaerota bacterium]MBO5695303.1 hypothetical protein [Lentisphaeria bacterium]MBR4884215.1 hypothetical protein [Lentisphaeria bacterium]
MDKNEEKALYGIVSRDPKYPVAAYKFVSAGVQYTVHSHQRTDKQGVERHVTGQELLRGILEFAALQYGFLAPDVLEYWNFRSGRDIGNTVYAMIGAGLLSAGPNDRLEDFDGIDDLVGAMSRILMRKKMNAEKGLDEHESGGEQ